LLSVTYVNSLKVTHLTSLPFSVTFQPNSIFNVVSRHVTSHNSIVFFPHFISPSHLETRDNINKATPKAEETSPSQPKNGSRPSIPSHRSPPPQLLLHPPRKHLPRPRRRWFVFSHFPSCSRTPAPHILTPSYPSSLDTPLPKPEAQT